MYAQQISAEYDVVIAGAGPAGCAAALTLKNSGLKVLIIDKASFPRDKVCGDAIPGRAVKVLKSIDPQLSLQLKQFSHKHDTKRAIASYKGKSITFNWSLDAYTCARMHFDNFLYSLVTQYSDAAIYTSAGLTGVTVNTDHVALTLGDDTVIHTRLVIGADGAQSVTAKLLAGRTIDRNHHAGSVRAYFSGITGLNDNTVEVYFDKKILPGYLWISPLPGGLANVGFGMLSAEIAKRKVNLRETFLEFVEFSPALRPRFINSKQVGELQGFGLPLGSRKVTLSGNRFMLCGDAASLIDPITGDGIGNAMLSGRLAALNAIRCFEADDFSAAFMKQYDRSIGQALSKELKDHYRIRRMLSAMPFLLDLTFAAGQTKLVKKLIARNF